MRLSRLDLIAFGKFTDVRLTLGPGFHLVYGPNEAGKSTTLRAIRQLLFGFDERTDDNFVHSNPNLRIGGVVSNSSGAEVEVIRRKTRKDSLRAGDDIAIIDPNHWTQLLAGIDEATFRQRYGIDYEQLVQGGHQIATGSGDLGDILFATGSGVMDLNSVKKKLVDDAAEIFKPQGKKQRLNLSIVMLQEQKEALRDKLLSVSEWEEADRIRQETLLRLENVSTSLAKQTNERDRFQRWQLAWPLVQELDSVEKELTLLRSIPRLIPDFSAKRQQAMLLLKQHSIHEQAARETIENAQNELEKLAKPQVLMSRPDEISNLVTEWGACQKGLHDRLKLVEDRDRHQASIRELLSSMSVPTNQIPDTTTIVDRTFRTRLGQLGRQQTGLQQSLEQATLLRGRLSAQLQELQESLKTLPEVRPLDDLRNLLRKIQNDGDLEVRLALAHKEMAEMQEVARQQIDRFGLEIKSISELASLKIPDLNWLKQSETGFQTNQAEQSLLRIRLADFEVEREKLCKTIEKLRNEFQLPTEADLQIARNRRAEIWSEIRRHFSNRIVPDSQLIDEFEQSITDTDSIADRLRNEADRVALLAEEVADLESNDLRVHEAAIRMAELQTERLALQHRWELAWQSVGANAPLPSETQAWLAQRETLLQNEIHIRRCEQESHQLAERIQENAQTLRKLMEIESTSSNECTLKDLIALAEEQLKKEESARQLRKEIIESIARWTREHSESLARVTTADNA
ncbi:MAG: AAA family ATPase, partial [Schlesneria sp.]